MFIDFWANKDIEGSLANDHVNNKAYILDGWTGGYYGEQCNYHEMNFASLYEADEAGVGHYQDYLTGLGFLSDGSMLHINPDPEAIKPGMSINPSEVEDNLGHHFLEVGEYLKYKKSWMFVYKYRDSCDGDGKVTEEYWIGGDAIDKTYFAV